MMMLAIMMLKIIMMIKIVMMNKLFLQGLDDEATVMTKQERWNESVSILQSK